MVSLTNIILKFLSRPINNKKTAPHDKWELYSCYDQYYGKFALKASTRGYVELDTRVDQGLLVAIERFQSGRRLRASWRRATRPRHSRLVCRYSLGSRRAPRRRGPRWVTVCPS